MKTPIFLNASGDVLVFESKENAEQYIEPVDVMNKEYKGYDSEGRLLELSVTEDGQVVLSATELFPTHQPELYDALVNFLSLVDKSVDVSPGVELKELVAHMLKYKIRY